MTDLLADDACKCSSSSSRHSRPHFKTSVVILLVIVVVQSTVTSALKSPESSSFQNDYIDTFDILNAVDDSYNSLFRDNVKNSGIFPKLWNRFKQYPMKVLKESYDTDTNTVKYMLDKLFEVTTAEPNVNDKDRSNEDISSESSENIVSQFEAVEPLSDTEGHTILLDTIQKFQELFLYGFLQTNITVGSSQDYWLLIKPNLQKVVSYLDEEYSISEMHNTIIFSFFEKIINFGDQLYLLKFLKSKLDDDFANYIVNSVHSYISPLGELGQVYRLLKKGEIANVFHDMGIDAFNSIFKTIGKPVLTYLINTHSTNELPDFLEYFLPMNSSLDFIRYFLVSNVESHKRMTRQLFSGEDDFMEDDLHKGARRNNGYNWLRRDSYGHDSGYHDDGYGYGKDSFHNDGYGKESYHKDSYGKDSYHKDSYGNDDSYGGYGHSSGHGGGGGYGGYGTATLDPYVVLGALALGTLLGFVLFRIINGTGANGRRVPENSLLLWLSDLPDSMEALANSTRAKRETVSEKTDTQWGSQGVLTDISKFENNLDPSVVSTDRLNGLWRTYKKSEDKQDVRRHFCEYLKNSTNLDRLSGTNSIEAILMASAGRLLGVAEAGQLLDSHAQGLVSGLTPVWPC